MFLNTAKFKKAVKKAYEGLGIHIEKRNNCYVLDAGWWFLQIGKSDFTKENMAAVISIVGELPEEGETYLYREGSGAQQTMKDTFCADLYNKYKNAKDEYELTNVCFRTRKSFVEILQNTSNRTHIMVPADFIEMLDKGKIEEDEYMQSDFGLSSEDLNIVIWASDRMYLACRKRPCRFYGEQNFMDKISNTDLAWSWGQSEEIPLS